MGQAKPTAQEGLFDSRLFNQSSGMDSGFGGGDERYNIYDKPLFVDRSKQSIYRIDSARMEQNVGYVFILQSTKKKEKKKRKKEKIIY